MNNRVEKTEAMAKGLQTANQGEQQIIHLEIKSISAAADVVQVSLVLMESFFVFGCTRLNVGPLSFLQSWRPNLKPVKVHRSSWRSGWRRQPQRWKR